MSPSRHHHALPEGYTLHWYTIDSILGQGGFGITYLAHDTNLDQPVAIKEFLPSDLATRTRDSAVHPLSAGHTDTYGWGLNRFLTEARTLAKFRHPNIVRVLSVFEANNTAYMVMEYERGESFENLLRRERLTAERDLEKVLLPLLDGLERVHETGFIHRDIKPSNIYLREDGVPVLLDFGSARLALGVETRTLTSLVSPGYAPFEQYNATRESDKQGPWTDIYALGATLYRAVTGKGPVDAAARADLLLEEKRDPFQPCAGMHLEGYSPRFLEAIDWALAFSPSDRPQTVAAWRRMLLAPSVDPQAQTLAVTPDATSVAEVDFALDAGDSATAPATGGASGDAREAATERAAETQPASGGLGRGWLVGAGVVSGVAIAAAVWLLLAPDAGERAPPLLVASAPDGIEAPAVAAAASPEPVGEVASEPAADTEAVVRQASSPPAAGATSLTREQPPRPVDESTPSAKAAAAVREESAEPIAEVTRIAREASPGAAAEPASGAPPPSEQLPAERVAKAPLRKPASEPAPPPENEAVEKARPAQPRTRAEKVAALLVTAENHLDANRLTEPRRANALRDYMTVLAMDTENAAAQRGVESIVERYLAMADDAVSAGRYERADRALEKTRFVLDAMDLREWPKAPYQALWDRYLEAARLRAEAR